MIRLASLLLLGFAASGAPQEADSDADGIPDNCERAAGDINLDGVVNGADLAVLLANWGSARPWSTGVAGCAPVADWATVVEWPTDPAIVTNQSLREAITATGLPWRVLHTATKIEFLLIPPGSFNMGCSASQLHACGGDEMPVHAVALTQPFYLSRYEITQAQWQAVMGSNPAYWDAAADSPSRPVEMVSWETVYDFLAATGTRLPTDAEWEYAYRAGTTSAFHGFPGYPAGTNDDALLSQIAWHSGNSGGQTHPVGKKAGNGFGLHDMSGNVQEWVSDWFDYYASGAATNPTGPASGTFKVMRGGAWNLSSYYGRSSNRDLNYPTNGTFLVGFRAAKTP